MHLSLSRRALLAGTGLATLGIRPLSARAAGQQPPMDLTDWSPVPALSDDFSDPARSEKLWHKGLWYPVSGKGAFDPRNVAVDGGRLRLLATTNPDGASQFHYGAVESHFDIPGVRSYVEVRAKVLDRRANILSAVWLQSSNRDGKDALLVGANPNPEIDVLETFNFSQVNSATHIWPDNRGDLHVAYGGNNYDAGVADLSTEYHRYGVERRDGVVRIYFNDQLAWELPAPHPSLALMSRHQVLSLEGHLGRPNLSSLPASFDIDYVHTYYYTGDRRAADGSYRVVNAASGRALLPVEAGALHLIPLNRNPRTRWRVQAADDFTYTLTSDKGSALGLQGGMGQEGVPASHDWGPTDITAEGSLRRWHIVARGDREFTLQSKFSGLALAATPDGQLVQQLPDGSAAQRWRLVG